MAYLRKYENELLVIFINFDKVEHYFRVHIPKNAFDVLQIPDNKVSFAREMLSGKESVCSLTYTCPFEGTIPALSSKIFKLNYSSNLYLTDFNR